MHSLHSFLFEYIHNNKSSKKHLIKACSSSMPKPIIINKKTKLTQMHKSYFASHQPLFVRRLSKRNEYKSIVSRNVRWTPAGEPSCCVLQRKPLDGCKRRRTSFLIRYFNTGEAIFTVINNARNFECNLFYFQNGNGAGWQVVYGRNVVFRIFICHIFCGQGFFELCRCLASVGS